jgi:hypothetical protein
MWGMREMISIYEMLVGNCNRRDYVGDRGLVRRMILKLI